MAVGEEYKRRMETSKMRFLISATRLSLREMKLRVQLQVNSRSRAADVPKTGMGMGKG
jgi:hypothetical protein